MKKIKVMHVDNEPHIVNSLKLGLDKELFEFTGLYCASECLNEIKKGNIPDIIILDISMPGMDGYQLCYELRYIKATKNTPIIFLTSKDGLHDKLKAIDVGADDFITKPYKFEDIIDEVNTRIKLLLVNK